MRGLVIIVALCLLACGGSRSRHSAIERGPDYSSTGGGGGGDTSPQPDAGVAFTASNPLTCPPSFAQMGGACDPSTHPGTCTYPEGSCYCGVTMPCSGAAISDEEIASWPSSWQCTAKPPLVRPDGCPGTQPNDGAACSPSGRTCVYGSCCVWRMSCEKGRWKSAGGECPP